MYDIAAKIANETDCIKTIDRTDQAIYDGKVFNIGWSTTVAATSTFYITVTTPNTTVTPYLKMGLGSSATVTLGFYTGPTAASTMAAKTAYNMNRASTAVATVVVRNEASSDITSTGTLLESYWVPAASQPIYIGGCYGYRGWKLAANTKYAIKINAASTTTYNINLSIYEA